MLCRVLNYIYLRMGNHKTSKYLSSNVSCLDKTGSSNNKCFVFLRMIRVFLNDLVVASMDVCS